VTDLSFDPFDPAQKDRHHDVMTELRETGPIARLDSGVLVVPRYGDVRSLLNVDTMRNSHAARAPGVVVPPEDRLFFFEYDPPEHVMLRRLMVDLFSRPRAARLAPAIRELVERLLVPIVETRRGELVQQFSVPLAGRLMMRVAGLPEDDADLWRGWIKDMVVSGFSFTNRNERGEGLEQCYPDVLAYLDRHLAGRPSLAGPYDDVLTRVVEARVDGEPLSRTHQRMIVFSVVSAGTNTLVNFMSNTLLSLARDQELLPRLRADRRLIAAAVEESLRRDSPSMYLTRRCVADTAVADELIAGGDRVLLGLASANRDRRAYPDPEEFRLDREEQPPHLAFGWGSHLCLGAPIARQAGVTALDTFLEHVGSIRLVAGREPRPYLSPQGNGLDELPVILAPLPNRG
jgi:cytochrome P450